MTLNLSNPLVILDLETTGLNLINDRIVEIACIKIMPNGEQTTFHKIVNPEMEIPLEASLLHGIYDKDVKEQPNFAQIAKELLLFLNGADIAGYNLLRFDIPILVENFWRVRINFEVKQRKIIDVQKIFVMMEKRNLKSAYKFYCQKELTGGHHALIDAQATLEILQEQIKMYENQSATDNFENVVGIIRNDVKSLHDLTIGNSADLSSNIVYNEKNLPILNFGKHKGKLVTEVLESDPYYIDWIKRTNFPRDTKRKLCEIEKDYFVSYKKIIEN